MEETIGYEALLSANEWDLLYIGEWTDDDGYNPDGSPSGVTPDNGKGCAAQCQSVASEGSFDSHSLGPAAASSCDGNDKDEEDPLHLEFVHEVSCRTRTLDDGTTTEYVLECDICEEIGTADDYEEADVIAQQHKTYNSAFGRSPR